MSWFVPWLIVNLWKCDSLGVSLREFFSFWQVCCEIAVWYFLGYYIVSKMCVCGMKNGKGMHRNSNELESINLKTLLKYILTKSKNVYWIVNPIQRRREVVEFVHSFAHFWYNFTSFSEIISPLLNNSPLELKATHSGSALHMNASNSIHHHLYGELIKSQTYADLSVGQSHSGKWGPCSFHPVQRTARGRSGIIRYWFDGWFGWGFHDWFHIENPICYLLLLLLYQFNHIYSQIPFSSPFHNAFMEFIHIDHFTLFQCFKNHIKV